MCLHLVPLIRTSHTKCFLHTGVAQSGTGLGIVPELGISEGVRVVRFTFHSMDWVFRMQLIKFTPREFSKSPQV